MKFILKSIVAWFVGCAIYFLLQDYLDTYTLKTLFVHGPDAGYAAANNSKLILAIINPMTLFGAFVVYSIAKKLFKSH